MSKWINDRSSFYYENNILVKSGQVINLSYRIKSGDEVIEYLENLEYIVGSNKWFQGLDDLLIDMQDGEKKIVQLPWSQIYGSQNQTQVLHIEQLIPEYTVKEPKALYENKTESNPFFGKSLKVWLEQKIGNLTLRIVDLWKDDITIQYVNSGSIFKSSMISVGDEASWWEWKMRVEEIKWSLVTVSIPSQHPFSRKFLSIEIYIGKNNVDVVPENPNIHTLSPDEGLNKDWYQFPIESYDVSTGLIAPEE